MTVFSMHRGCHGPWFWVAKLTIVVLFILPGLSALAESPQAGETLTGDQAAFEAAVHELRDAAEKVRSREVEMWDRVNDKKITITVELSPYFVQLRKALALAKTPEQIVFVLSQTPKGNLVASTWEAKKPVFGIFNDTTGKVTARDDQTEKYLEERSRILDEVAEQFRTRGPSSEAVMEMIRLRAQIASEQRRRLEAAQKRIQKRRPFPDDEAMVKRLQPAVTESDRKQMEDLATFFGTKPSQEQANDLARDSGLGKALKAQIRSQSKTVVLEKTKPVVPAYQLVTKPPPKGTEAQPLNPRQKAFETALHELQDAVEGVKTSERETWDEKGVHDKKIVNKVELDRYFAQLKIALAFARTPEEIVFALNQTPRGSLVAKTWEAKKPVLGVFNDIEGKVTAYDDKTEKYLEERSNLLDSVAKRFKAGAPSSEAAMEMIRLRGQIAFEQRRRLEAAQKRIQKRRPFPDDEAMVKRLQPAVAESDRKQSENLATFLGTKPSQRQVKELMGDTSLSKGLMEELKSQSKALALEKTKPPVPGYKMLTNPPPKAKPAATTVAREVNPVDPEEERKADLSTQIQNLETMVRPHNVQKTETKETIRGIESKGSDVASDTFVKDFFPALQKGLDLARTNEEVEKLLSIQPYPGSLVSRDWTFSRFGSADRQTVDGSVDRSQLVAYRAARAKFLDDNLKTLQDQGKLTPQIALALLRARAELKPDAPKLKEYTDAFWTTSPSPAEFRKLLKSVPDELKDGLWAEAKEREMRLAHPTLIGRHLADGVAAGWRTLCSWAHVGQ